MPRCNDPITVRSLASAALLALVVACSSGNGGNSAQAPIQGEAHDPSEPAPPTAADARSLLDRRFAAQPACGAFFAMPWDVSTDSARDRRRATALVQAGLLRPAGESRLPGAGGGQAALRFVPTAAGAATFRAPAADEGGVPGLICYGKVEVTDASVTDADPMMGTGTIRYRYRLTDVPEWTRHPAVAAIWPWLPQQLAKEGEATERLALRDGGWQLESTPRPAAFDLRDLSR
ncbi:MULTISPECIES: hypothetical protein [Sphingomonas]|jgi:hypothetical protein|uniref:Lipoprotein n=1 Tax=Sphingomonas ginsenosidimutans TaxID=862134 RepID=A0A2A4HX06_9SPHN|nr:MULTISPECIES: hypothetical protein [Sphingomonas]MBY0300957.1 hypothetical protein [Sphingomonas ginsenosidimutans]PCG09402.1 hypothetical protein COA17_05780 [Sphingomonas ginsenosidimutans]